MSTPSYLNTIFDLTLHCKFLISRNLLKSIKKIFNIYLPNIEARQKELRESPISYKSEFSHQYDIDNIQPKNIKISVAVDKMTYWC